MMIKISILFLLFLFPIMGKCQTSGLEINKDEITTGGGNYSPSFFMTDYALNSKQVAKGKIKSISQFDYKVKEKFGDIVKEKIISSSPTFFYDMFGKIKECKWTQGNNVEKRCLYIYNIEGNLIEINEYFFNKKLYQKTKFKLNSKGDHIEKNIYDKDGDLTENHKFEYDQNRNLISDAQFNKYNELEYLTLFGYNDKNLKLTEKHYEGNNILLNEYFFEYNDKNQIIKLIHSENNDLLHFRKYEYDTQGHIISITTFYEIERYDSEEFVPLTDKTNYDGNGNLITPENYRLGNFIKPEVDFYTNEYFKYIYDKNGNWISRTAFGSYEKANEIIERKIEYYE